MATVYIVERRISDDPETGKERWKFHVKMQLGRSFPIVHLGSWDTRPIARAKRKAALEQLARGEMPTLNPEPAFAPLNTTVRRLGEEWLASRVDFEDSTKRTVGTHLAGINKRFGPRDPASITIADLRAWISDETTGTDGLMTSTLRKRLNWLAQILDEGKVDPNPVRARELKLPRDEDVPKWLPRPSELRRLYAALEPDSNPATRERGKNIPVVRLMEQTGMRIHEVVAVRYQDWDRRRGRLLVPKSKTNAGKRLIDSMPEQPYAVFDIPPRGPGVRDDARVFSNVTISSVAGAMYSASKRAGLEHTISPHVLRHLHLSRLLHYGILSPAPLAGRAGHKSPDITLSVYSHVIPPEDDDELDQAAAHDDDPRALTSASSTSER